MLSDERQIHWTHLIVEGFLKKGFLQNQDKDRALRAVRRAVSCFVREHDLIEQKVRQKIAGLKRNVQEHSSEWEVLYSRYYEEELSRSHFNSP